MRVTRSLIEPTGRPYVFCPKCRTNVVWPERLSAEEKSGLAAQVRSSPSSGAKLAHMQFGLDLREAKALWSPTSSVSSRAIYQLKTDELQGTQFILIDKEYTPPLRDLKLRVNSRHMKPIDPSRPDDRENPPLIPYYRGN